MELCVGFVMGAITAWICIKMMAWKTDGEIEKDGDV